VDQVVELLDPVVGLAALTQLARVNEWAQSARALWNFPVENMPTDGNNAIMVTSKALPVWLRVGNVLHRQQAQWSL